MNIIVTSLVRLLEITLVRSPIEKFDKSICLILIGKFLNVIKKCGIPEFWESASGSTTLLPTENV